MAGPFPTQTVETAGLKRSAVVARLHPYRSHKEDGAGPLLARLEDGEFLVDETVLLTDLVELSLDLAL